MGRRLGAEGKQNMNEQRDKRTGFPDGSGGVRLNPSLRLSPKHTTTALNHQTKAQKIIEQGGIRTLAISDCGECLELS